MQKQLFTLVVVGAGAAVGAIAVNRARPGSAAESTAEVASLFGTLEPFLAILLFVAAGVGLVTMLNGVVQ